MQLLMRIGGGPGQPLAREVQRARRIAIDEEGVSQHLHREPRFSHVVAALDRTRFDRLDRRDERKQRAGAQLARRHRVAEQNIDRPPRAARQFRAQHRAHQPDRAAVDQIGRGAADIGDQPERHVGHGAVRVALDQRRVMASRLTAPGEVHVNRGIGEQQIVIVQRAGADDLVEPSGRARRQHDIVLDDMQMGAGADPALKQRVMRQQAAGLTGGQAWRGDAGVGAVDGGETGVASRRVEAGEPGRHGEAACMAAIEVDTETVVHGGHGVRRGRGGIGDDIGKMVGATGIEPVTPTVSR